MINMPAAYIMDVWHSQEATHKKTGAEFHVSGKLWLFFTLVLYSSHYRLSLTELRSMQASLEA